MPEPNRRASHIGLLRPTQENVTASSTEKPLQRRQSIAGVFATRHNGILSEEKKDTVPSTPGSSRKHTPHRTNLGAASAYYFSGLPKTPLDKAASSRKKLALTMQHHENSVSMSFDAEGYVEDYDGSPPAVETSYLSSSSGSSSGDALNQSVLSDTTELTASNFVFATQSRQRLSLASNRRDSTALKSKDATPTPQAVKTSEDLHEMRPPLAGMEGNKPSDRRKTLPPGYMVQQKAISSENPPNRRDSWQGASDSDHDETKERAMGLLAAMRRRRLNRQSAGSRLSMGSAVSSNSDTGNRGSSEDLEEEGSRANGRTPFATRTSPSVVPVAQSPKSFIADDRPSASDKAAEELQSPSIEMTINDKPSLENRERDPLAADDESLVSAGSLFDDLLSTDKSKEHTATGSAEFTLRPSLASELFQVNEHVDSPMANHDEPKTFEESSVVDSMVLEESENEEAAKESAVGFESKPSQLETSVHKPNPSKSPRPLPDMVAFASQNTRESLLAEATSPFRLKPVPKSPGVTPSKLEPSPRRVPNPSAVDSPARNTRSRLSLLSHEKKRKLDEAIDMGQEGLETNKKRRESSVASVSLNSSFRKGPKPQGSARKVAFGSPEFMEYNVTSPSMSMTPMPKRTSEGRMSAIPDDTVEIEADMNALFQSIKHPELVDQLSASVISTAGGTPFAKRRLSGSSHNENTVDLELNLQDVLDQAEDKPSYDTEDDSKSDMSDDSQARNLVGEQTEALEVSMGELLSNTTPYVPKMEPGPPQTGSDAQPAIQVDEEEEDRTVELEVDMSALLDAAEGPEESQDIEMAEESTSVGHRRRRSSIASKRFSLEPKSRLSLSGIFPDETTEDTNAAEIVVAVKIEPVLELKIGDILSMTQSVEHPRMLAPDIFAQTSHFLKENPSALAAESLNTFLQEVCDYLEVYDTPGVDPDLIAQLSTDEQAGVLKLQEGLQSENRAAVESTVGRLLNASKRCEELAWSKWLLDTAEQLKEHLSGYHGEVQAELERLARDTQLVDDTESLLSSIQERAFKKARRNSLERRKTKASALEEEIRLLEEQVAEKAEKFEAAKTKKIKADGVLVAVKEKSGLVKTQETTHTSADSMGRQWTMLKPISSWDAKTVARDRMTFAYVGPCPSASLSVSFHLTSSGKVSCLAKIDPTVYPKNKSRNSIKYKMMTEFLVVRTQHVCKKLCSASLQGMESVGDTLRQAGWELHRAELTADDLYGVHRRYDANLSVVHPTQGKPPAFELQIKFENASKSSKVATFFEVEESYPFSPLIAEIDVVKGDADVDALHQAVVKTAKPGFGYLARISDVIAASLQ